MSNDVSWKAVDVPVTRLARPAELVARDTKDNGGYRVFDKDHIAGLKMGRHCKENRGRAELAS